MDSAFLNLSGWKRFFLASFTLLIIVLTIYLTIHYYYKLDDFWLGTLFFFKSLPDLLKDVSIIVFSILLTFYMEIFFSKKEKEVKKNKIPIFLCSCIFLAVYVLTKFSGDLVNEVVNKKFHDRLIDIQGVEMEKVVPRSEADVEKTTSQNFTPPVIEVPSK